MKKKVSCVLIPFLFFLLLFSTIMTALFAYYSGFITFATNDLQAVYVSRMGEGSVHVLKMKKGFTKIENIQYKEITNGKTVVVNDYPTRNLKNFYIQIPNSEVKQKRVIQVTADSSFLGIFKRSYLVFKQTCEYDGSCESQTF